MACASGFHRICMRSSSEFAVHRALGRARAVACAAGLCLAAGGAEAAIFKNGLIDHLLCCGNGGPLSFDGTPVRGAGAASVAGGVDKSAFVGESRTPPNASAAGRAVVPVASVTAPMAASTEVAAPAAPKEIGGVLQIEFARLSDFKIEAPAFDPNIKTEVTLAAMDQQIPVAIKEYSGRLVQITGFMLPVKMDGQLVSEFLLMRDQMMCCYGVTPRLNDWIVVRMQKPVRYTPDVPVAFRGKFQVKAMQEQGFVTGIYLLEGATPGKS
jgi:hypothetical protein